MDEKRTTMEEIQTDSASDSPRDNSEKKGHDIEVNPVDSRDDLEHLDTEKIIVPEENDEFIDPRLKDYPIPLVA
jgi:hypothetical protein